LQAEARGRRELRHQVVVVGVEPLGHLEREAAVLGMGAAVIVALRRDAPGHREVARELRLVAAEVEARRLASQQLDMVGHVVVEGEVADGHEVEPGVALRLPVAGAQLAAGGFERVALDFAAPVLFERELEFALRAHARKAEGVDACHPPMVGVPRL
jgi:hypothetical protein